MEIGIDQQHLMAGLGKAGRQIGAGGGLALLRHRGCDGQRLERLAGGIEQQRGTDIAVGLGEAAGGIHLADPIGGVALLLPMGGRHEPQIKRSQAARHIVRIADRVVHEFQQEDQAHPERQAEDRRQEQALQIARLQRPARSDRPLQDPHGLRLDAGRNVHFLQPVENQVVQTLQPVQRALQPLVFLLLAVDIQRLLLPRLFDAAGGPLLDAQRLQLGVVLLQRKLDLDLDGLFILLQFQQRILDERMLVLVLLPVGHQLGLQDGVVPLQAVPTRRGDNAMLDEAFHAFPGRDGRPVRSRRGGRLGRRRGDGCRGGQPVFQRGQNHLVGGLGQQRLLGFHEHPMRAVLRRLPRQVGQQVRRDIAALLDAHHAVLADKRQQIGLRLGDLLGQPVGLLGQVDHRVLRTAAAFLRFVFDIGVGQGVRVIRAEVGFERIHADGQDGGLPQRIHPEGPELGVELLRGEVQLVLGALDHFAAVDDVALRLGVVAQDGFHVALLEVRRQPDGPGQVDLGGGLVFRHLARHHDQHDHDGGHEAKQQQPQPFRNHVEILAEIQALLGAGRPLPAFRGGGGRQGLRPLDHVAHIRAPAGLSRAQ